MLKKFLTHCDLYFFLNLLGINSSTINRESKLFSFAIFIILLISFFFAPRHGKSKKTFFLNLLSKYINFEGRLILIPLTFDLKELKIDWEKVEDYYIKYTTLYIEFKDGTTEEHEGFLSEIIINGQMKKNY